MKHLKLRLILLVLLVCLAFASAAFALKPLIDGAEKSIEVKQAVEECRETITGIREEAEKAEENEEQHEPIPYAQLYEDMQFYNRQLYLFKQDKLDSRSAYELSQFKLTDYGLPDETFGIITIPKQFGVLYAAAKHENKETGVLHIISNVNYSAQLNAVMEAIGYPLPEVKQEEQAAKKAKARAPQERSSEERGTGLNQPQRDEKPSTRQKLAELDTVAKQKKKRNPVRQTDRVR